MNATYNNMQSQFCASDKFQKISATIIHLHAISKLKSEPELEVLSLEGQNVKILKLKSLNELSKCVTFYICVCYDFFYIKNWMYRNEILIFLA